MRGATILAIPEIAHQIALIPFLWLAWLRFRGRAIGAEWWWLAAAFFVSWLADTASHFGGPWVMSKVYPVTQAAIVGAVFLNRRDAMIFVLALVVVGVMDVLWIGVGDFDILLRTVAWLLVVGIVWPLRQLGRLRTSLLVAFGVAWFFWLGYAIWPGWSSWLLYQSARLSSILLFCWAATSPLPQLKLTRA